MRVFAVSDVHVDYEENETWIYLISKTEYKDDVLILAGDISDNLKLLCRCFDHLVKCFKKVLFVPGNHDLWVFRNEIDCSLEKFHVVNELASQLGISTDTYQEGGVSIVPLLGWYDFSFGAPCAQIKSSWMDFTACKWPAGYDERYLTQFFTGKNKDRLDVENDTVISFSHFLPRIDVMPSYIPKRFRYIYPVLGSTLIEKQVRALNSDIHIYGHSHVNRRVRLDGTTYINNAFGSPAERRTTSKKLRCIYDSEKPPTKRR
ncbi:MAG: metallophosphoesterase [Moraxellaceae bacterium]|nr:MAG: metallophosphoesterase [Moraxellaceae bacterium]